MKTDIEISQEANLEDIDQICEKIGLEDYEKLGKYKAKIDLSYLQKDKKDSKLVLVTATNPTPSGEGKTTVNIGLSMALNKVGKNAISVLREPSLGPSFGRKGGATGGGYSQVLPMDEINLHFTGDFHAITSSVNLVAAIIDNHIYQGNEKNIDPKQIVWRRCVDLNDRALRNVVIGMGNKTDGVIREDKFDITVATEMMAVLCLATSLDDFKRRVGKMIVAYDIYNNPVTVDDIKATGSVAVLMKDALKPNLVQTIENTPAIIHGGPFANIAHGCNSLIATKTALAISDYVVTEAGFGADLGAEKFNDIKCRLGDIKPDATVIVTSIRSLKYQAGMPSDALQEENLDYLNKGFENLKIHIENMKKFGTNIVVAINKFDTDTDEEISQLKSLTKSMEVNAIETTVFANGSQGGIDLANEVVDLCEKDNGFEFLYDVNLTIKEKLEKISKDIYRAKDVVYTKKANKDIKRIEDLGYDNLPICVAKTPYSFSDDPNIRITDKDYDITIREARINAGAGFIVAYTSNILTMPGLPKTPNAYEIDIDSNNKIVGLS
ncbi:MULTISPECIES: formate--tetrahydrofolate ligase [Anaerococcus]|uniref:formate--tetrahydrofolate ligase n=1 Tax=Anaerococcus TaxID=165779 RepID=UPI001AE65320|nr:MULTISPECIES: formate--tetrahydrofolate ligase [Anaerococcus]MBP2069776.1 formate--tetrahydrofolate ligase [Anaerococcus nagyae]MDU1828993.1 formate--tetrahydrofolate ligase [Anaerococcus sp.]MDU1863990.1 formate--tetrahydrofolate ligase [Anaerococcus sp.]MDU2353645.1 formate--tetrahydrofolate ligase [Anaerococcus sp.]MDU2565540.1 formate--tetrahydrofolate ligase [Anaerococcus sp.]